MRYRILEYNDGGEWHAAGIMADAGWELLRFQGGRMSPGPQKLIEDVGPEDFPGSWDLEELRITEVREVAEQPTDARVLDLMVDLLTSHRPELSRK